MPDPTVSPVPPVSDESLVQAAQAGDFGAFEQLVTRHEGRLYALAIHLLRQEQDAEDVVQSTFLSAMEHLEGFRGESSFGTWIRRIATNKALNLIRRRRAARSVSLDVGDEEPIGRPEYIADWRSDLARTVESRELNRILDRAIDGLPEKYRLVFVLRDVEGLSIAETAQVLQLTPSNVKVRLLRARLMLREELTRRFGAPETQVSPADHHDHAHGHRHPGEES